MRKSSTDSSDTDLQSGSPSIARDAARARFPASWFWLAWTLVSIAALLLSFPLSQVATVLPAVWSAVLSWAIMGAVLGAGQALLLRRQMRDAWLWIVATAAGLGIGVTVAAVVFSPIAGLGDLFVVGAVSGLLLGLAQLLVLRRSYERSGWWILASTIGWAVGLVLFIGVEAANLADLLLELASLGLVANLPGGLLLTFFLRPQPPDLPSPPEADFTARS